MSTILTFFMYAAGCGLILTLIAYILALLGLVLSYEGFWRYLFFGLFVVWFAAIVAANSVVQDFKQRDFWKAVLRGCPNWMKYMCYFFIGYAFLYFLLAMATSASSGSPNADRVLSASLLSFYSVATAILYSAIHVRKHDETRRCPNGHPVSPSAIFCEQCGAKIAVSQKDNPPLAPTASIVLNEASLLQRLSGIALGSQSKQKRAKPKEDDMVEVRFSSKTGVRCARQNCRRSIEKASDEPLQLPPGWRMLVISSGSTPGSENIMTARVNAALCPDHVKELYGVLDSETFALTIHEAQKPHKK